jgi:hypothetical protein
MKLQTVALIAVLFVATDLRAVDKPESRAKDVSYCDLVKTPQLFSGKRIRVRAIYDYAFEIQSLNQPGCWPTHGDRIWVEIEAELEGSSLKLFRKFPKGMGSALATYEGRFETGQAYGDGGYRSKLTVDKIEKLEATAKASKDKTAWVPKNCEEQTSAAKAHSFLTVRHE